LYLSPVWRVVCSRIFNAALSSSNKGKDVDERTPKLSVSQNWLKRSCRAWSVSYAGWWKACWCEEVDAKQWLPLVRFHTTQNEF
jgi:hypothetical protein